MKHLSLFPSSPPSSVLGFGTAGLMGVPTKRERLALLETAFDAGIRHYDTAPYYGYGEAERLLGEFLVGKRDQVTLTTKFGIEPPAIARFGWLIQTVRTIRNAVPVLKKAIAQTAKGLTSHPALTPQGAERSLQRSLAALKVDHVELFLLHEPTYAHASAADLIAHLDRDVDSGRIRAYGCGGVFPVIRQVAAAGLPSSRWLQFEDNIWNRNIEGIRGTGAHCLTFRTFHRGLRELGAMLAAEPEVRARWEKALDLGLLENSHLADLMQAASHQRNPDGILLAFSSRPERIRRASEVADGRIFSIDQIARFDELVRAWQSRNQAASSGK